jgi:hypothetical protein
MGGGVSWQSNASGLVTFHLNRLQFLLKLILIALNVPGDQPFPPLIEFLGGGKVLSPTLPALDDIKDGEAAVRAFEATFQKNRPKRPISCGQVTPLATCTARIGAGPNSAEGTVKEMPTQR